jgi:dienelactone hydrolase
VPLGGSDVGEVRVERVRFTPETGHDAVAALYRPKAAQGKLPTVIVQHFLGGTKDHFALTVLMTQLAQKGFLAAAIDGRYRGDRQNGVALNAAILQSLRTGKGNPLFFDTAYDITRFLDYLQTRPDVDGERIGMTGFSEGGVITWMTAVLDDRIKVAVPFIGVTCFGDTLRASEATAADSRTRLFDPILKDYATDLGETSVNARVLRTAWEKLCPGMLDRFDAPQLVPLIAPRPLLILNHEKDELFPIEGARKVEAVVRARYAAEKAEDRLSFQVAPGLTHSQFNIPEVQRMVDWMTRWLKAPN